MYILHFPYPFICQGTFRFLQILAIVNNASVNMEMHISLGVLWLYTQNWDCWIMYNSIFRFLTMLFSTVAVPFYISTNSVKVPISPHPHQHCYLWGFFFSLIIVISCEKIAHCTFDLHFPVNCNVKHFFIYLFYTYMFSLKKCLFKSFAHFSLGILLFCYWVIRVHYIF